MTFATGTIAPFAAIMVAVPTSKTCRMCGALPARYEAMAAVIDSGYVPLKLGTTLYWFCDLLKLVASSFTLSPSAPAIECQNWISVCASALVDARPRPSTASRVLRIMGFLLGMGDRRLWSWYV